jgi:hypothetical protein
MDITFNTIITNPGKYLYYQYCTGTKHIDQYISKKNNTILAFDKMWIPLQYICSKFAITE